MPDTINGVPTHPLLVHAVVVLLPLAALLVSAAALISSIRRRLGVLVPLLTLVTLALIPVTTDAGEWLERHVTSTELIRRHTQVADSLLPWAIGLFVVATGIWVLWRWFPGVIGDSSSSRAVPIRVVIAVVALAVSIGTVVQVYRIGDSGAKAVWDGQLTGTGGNEPPR